MEYCSFSTEYGAADELFKAIMSLDKERGSNAEKYCRENNVAYKYEEE